MPSSFNIRLYGDPCLRKKSTPLKLITDKTRHLIQSMILIMHEHKGIGLAAPQLGVNERFIVVDIGEGPIVLVNPEVTTTEGLAELEEGCLSIPGIVVNVKRPQKISVRYLDQNNKKIEKSCEDLLARVILHEIDHLNGKLIIDYLSFREKLKLRKQLKDIKKGIRGQFPIVK